MTCLDVGIDYRLALRPNPTGIGRYIRDLMKTLPCVCADQSYTLFHDRRAEETPPVCGNVRNHATAWPAFRRLGGGLIWEEAWLPIEIYRRNIGVYHGPASLIPSVVPSRTGIVITAHDVVYNVMPETMGYLHRRRLRMTAGHALRRADVIIADSQNTASEIIRYHHVAIDAVKVIYPGINDTFRQMSPESARDIVIQHFGIARPYILYVGGLTERKNVIVVLKAYAILRDALSGELDLVLTGYLDRAGPLMEFVRARGLSGVVHFPGYVADDLLPALYGAATVFVYPSLYEGFGYPVLEAMSCGAPVVCSNASSLPEVAGRAGILVGPSAVDAWVRALRSVVESPSRQNSLRAAGFEQAARFSLRRQALATSEAYALARLMAQRRSSIARARTYSWR